ncbi:MAG: hypothetical protein ABIW76_16050 [Fibrobacteria bacterium]
MNKPLLLLALALFPLSLAFQNCAKSPTEKASNTDVDPSVAQAKADSESWAMLLPAYQLNDNAASLQRMKALKSISATPAITVNTRLPAFGAPVAGDNPALAAKTRPNVAGALLKGGALGKMGSGASGAGSARAQVIAGIDTAFLLLADSAHGAILKVHQFQLTESGASVDAADTLVCKWPYDPASPTVLGHKGARAYANGSRLTYAIADEDGDNILNEAVSPKSVQLRKLWMTVHGDTTWKSIVHTIHGGTTFYDSIGPGTPGSWMDSVFVGGKKVYAQTIFDGDGDNRVNTAATGKKVLVKRDIFSESALGVLTTAFELWSPGADGKFETEADNQLYPYQSLTVGAMGSIAQTFYGDLDGDGFYWNPDPAGANLASIRNEYPVPESLTVYRDSLEQILSGPSGSGKRITFYQATRKYKDGRRADVTTRMPGGAGAFSARDTVQVWERLSLIGYTAKGASDPFTGLDSTLQVTWMVPGKLETSGDDQVIKSFSQAFHTQGQASRFESELFTPSLPLTYGEKPKSGTLVRETRANPTSSKSVIRTLLFQEIDDAHAEGSWKRTDFFESGDSAVATGSGKLDGAGTYAKDLGNGARHSGFYDAASGEFQDTLILLDFMGGVKAKEIAYGTYDAARGTGDFHRKRTGSKDTATAHLVVSANGAEGLLLTRTTSAGSLEIAFRADSDPVGEAVLIKTSGGVKRRYIWTAGDGANAVSQNDENAQSGAVVAHGNYSFGQDLSGVGTFTRTPTGKPAVESKVQFQSDGTVYQDGVKVSN